MNLPVKSNAPSLLMDPERFNHMQRVGAMLALSPLFPDHLRKGSKETAIANGVLVMNMAARLDEDPLTVAQNIYFVSGKPGWSSSYMIGKASQHGVFKNPISWEITGAGPDLSVTAFAELASTGKRVEATTSMAMAKAEGWTKNSKYNSMPEQMLRYRSATFLIRLYCPEVMIGVPAQVEVEMAMKDVTPADFADISANTSESDAKTEIQDAEVTPEAEKSPELAQSGKPEAEAIDAETGEVSDASAPTPDPDQFRGLLDMIKRDLLDAPIADVLEMYGPQIEQMKEAAPELHKELQAEIDEFKKADT